MRFEWDPEKARANLAKHGVHFEDAAEVFSDPLARSVQDRHEGSEERWQTMGLVGRVVLLVVAHTWRGDGIGEDVVRIISARRATKREKRSYERGG